MALVVIQAFHRTLPDLPAADHFFHLDYSKQYVLPLSHLDDVWSHVATESCDLRQRQNLNIVNFGHLEREPQDATRCYKRSKISVDILRNWKPGFNIFATNLCATNLASCELYAILVPKISKA